MPKINCPVSDSSNRVVLNWTSSLPAVDPYSAGLLFAESPTWRTVDISEKSEVSGYHLAHGHSLFQ